MHADLDHAAIQCRFVRRLVLGAREVDSHDIPVEGQERMETDEDCSLPFWFSVSGVEGFKRCEGEGDGDVAQWGVRRSRAFGVEFGR